MYVWIIIIIIINLFELQMRFYPVAVVLLKDTTHKIPHHAQTKHSTQRHKSNERHITHNRKEKKVKLSLLEAHRVEMSRIAHCLDSRLTAGG
jgi:hypothetical protein